MNPLMFERIKKDFPEIIWQHSALNYGIECGTGWGLLIHAFLADATAVCHNAGGHLVVSQIKNKSGSLHLYCQQKGGRPAKDTKKEYLPEHYTQVVSIRPYPTNPTLRTLVSFYESASVGICELCGRPGHIDPDVSSWLSPLCHPHAKLVEKSYYHDAPNEYDEIDRLAAEKICERLDELAKKKKQ